MPLPHACYLYPTFFSSLHLPHLHLTTPATCCSHSLPVPPFSSTSPRQYIYYTAGTRAVYCSIYARAWWQHHCTALPALLAALVTWVACAVLNLEACTDVIMERYAGGQRGGGQTGYANVDVGGSQQQPVTVNVNGTFFFFPPACRLIDVNYSLCRGPNTKR